MYKKLKILAKDQLGNNVFRNRWITMMAICAIALLADVYLAGVAPFTGFLIGPVFAIIVGGPLLYGAIKALLECAAGERWSFTHVLHGFLDCFGGSMILGFLQWLFLTVWTMLLIVPGIIKSYAYAFAFHIQCENNEKEGIDCLMESEALMKGHKMELFKLDVGFIGWYLLGVLCAGVGVLFVIPYHMLARTNFYLKLKEEKQQEEIQKILEAAEKAEVQNG